MLTLSARVGECRRGLGLHCLHRGKVRKLHRPEYVRYLLCRNLFAQRRKQLHRLSDRHLQRRERIRVHKLCRWNVYGYPVVSELRSVQRGYL